MKILEQELHLKYYSTLFNIALNYPTFEQTSIFISIIVCQFVTDSTKFDS